MKLARMLSVGAVVLTLTAVTGCRASTRVALDGGMIGEPSDATCQPAAANGLLTFMPITISNQSGVVAHVTNVSLPRSSPFEVIDWWVIPLPENFQGSAPPWTKAANRSTKVGSSHYAEIAVDLRAVNPRILSEWWRGFRIGYETSRGSASVTAGDVIVVPARGSSCPNLALLVSQGDGH